MTTMMEALTSLGVRQFSLRGTLTTEAEFNKSFRPIVGYTDDGSAIESDDPATFGVTWKQAKERKYRRELRDMTQHAKSLEDVNRKSRYPYSRGPVSSLMAYMEVG